MTLAEQAISMSIREERRYRPVHDPHPRPGTLAGQAIELSARDIAAGGRGTLAAALRAGFAEKDRERG